MTKPPPLNNDTEPRPWILQTLGLAFGLAVLLVVIVTVAALALESPSSRRAVTVRAVPLATATPFDAPAATADPTQTPVARPLAVSVSAQTAFEVRLPLVVNQDQVKRAMAQAPTRTPLAAATPVPTARPRLTAKPVARLVVTRSAASKSSARQPVAVTAAPVTATPVPRELDFSFYVKAWCGTRKTQTLQFMITGHGGQPPYDYYNDAVLLAQKEFGSVRYTFDAPAGNPVPLKLIVVDSAGARFVQDMFYKTHLQCGSAF